MRVICLHLLHVEPARNAHRYAARRSKQCMVAYAAVAVVAYLQAKEGAEQSRAGSLQ